MQKELSEQGYEIYFLGINETGFESANGTVTEGRDLPWLQDTADVNMWNRWSVNYRDVIIFDEELNMRERYNLSTFNLNEEMYYNELYSLLTSL